MTSTNVPLQTFCNQSTKYPEILPYPLRRLHYADGGLSLLPVRRAQNPPCMLLRAVHGETPQRAAIYAAKQNGPLAVHKLASCGLLLRSSSGDGTRRKLKHLLPLHITRVTLFELQKPRKKRLGTLVLGQSENSWKQNSLFHFI